MEINSKTIERPMEFLAFLPETGAKMRMHPICAVAGLLGP